MEDVALIRQIYGRVQQEIDKVLVGKADMVKLVMVALLSDGHVLFEGVPGVAKTLTAKAFSRSLGLAFRRIQFTPDMLPSDITGTFVFDPNTREFEFRKGPVFANVILADEINRATPKTQSALLEAMQEKQVTVEGATEKIGEPFIVLATQNPIELEGTYPLPEAQLDRFMFRLIMEYPTHGEEVRILQKTVTGLDTDSVEGAVDTSEVLEARKIISTIHASEEVLDYIVSVVEATRRDSERVLLGGSPRASVQLLTASRCLAAMDGRDYVVPDDVKELAFPLLNHRIILNPEYALKSGALSTVVNYEKVKAIVLDAVTSVRPPR